MIWIKSANVYPQVVENKYQPGIPEREALQDWDLREVVSFKFIFIFFSDPFTDLFDFPINSRYQDLDLNKEIFHKFCFTAMILMLTFMMWNDSRLKAHSLTWRGRQRLNMAKPVAVSGHQGTINCGILVPGVGGRGDPRKKWEEKCCFCLQNDLKEHRNARSVYIAFQKAWFTAFIAIIKKVEHTP